VPAGRSPRHQRDLPDAAKFRRRRALTFGLPLHRPYCYKPAMSADSRIGFLGAGKMATALAKGFARAALAPPEGIVASDVSEAARAHFAQEVGGATTASNPEVVRAARTLVLAVKPGQVAEVLADIRPHLTDSHLVISIAAGLPLARLEGLLFEGARVVRVMPNAPALVGACAAAFARGSSATSEDAARVKQLFSAVGLVFEVTEDLLDAVTGLSGSGPAFVALVIEALSDGGVAAGLPREVATRLAAQTVLGAAQMILQSGLHPGALKDMVTSPGGTTIEGVHELEKAGVRGAFLAAVRAAARKAAQLGQTA
jgi:pyrroline-5-carboxylate reductase